MIRPRIDRLFAKYLGTGNPTLLAKVLDQAAPELWRVAAHLCRTRQDAEDAVQSAFLAAIENQSAWNPKRPLMPWLVGILINRAREQRRKCSRAVDPSAVAAALSPDPAKLASEREFVAALETALREVSEPYRSVVEQHLIAGVAANDIASAIGVPAATVRTRLHRGLEQLRKRLPVGVGTFGLVPMCIPSKSLAEVSKIVMGRARVQSVAGASSGVAAVALIAGIKMNKVLAVAVALAVGLTSWQLLGEGASPKGQRQQHVEREVIAAVVADDVPEKAGKPDAVAQSLFSGSARVAVALAGELDVLVRHGKTKQPLAGIEVVAHVDQGARAAASVDPAVPQVATAESYEQAAPTRAQGATDEHGRVRLLIAAGSVRVGATHGPPQLTFATVVVGKVTEHVIDIAADLVADVRVVGEHGEAIPFATILGRTEIDYQEKVLGTADEHGRWHEDRTDRALFVRAATRELAASVVQLLTIGTPQAVITLTEKSAAIHGLVMDETGKAVANATVVFAAQNPGLSIDLPISVRCDEQGRYRCSWLQEGTYHLLACLQDVNGQVRRAMAFRAQAVCGDGAPSNLQLTAGASIVAQLRRPNGQPLINHTLQIMLISRDTDRRFARWFARHAATDSQGACTLRNLMPGRYLLTVGFNNASVEREVDLLEGQSLRFEHTFARLLTQDIQVVDENAEPRAGVRVSIRTSKNKVVLKTDAAGRVRFEGLANRDHEVSLSTPDEHFAQVRQTVSPAAGVVRLVMPRGVGHGRIEGRFEGANRAMPASLAASLSPDGSSALRPEQIPVKVDLSTGQFVVGPLHPGKYVLVARIGFVAMAIRGSIEVTAGQAVDLGAIRLGVGKIRIELAGSKDVGLFRAGAAHEAQGVFMLRPPGDKQSATGNVLELDNLPEGPYRVLVWGERMLPSMASTTVVIGETTVLRMHASPGVRTEVRLPVGMGLLDLRLPDGWLLRELTNGGKWVRGLAPGKHRVRYSGQGGAEYEAQFDVGVGPGRPIELRKISR